MKARWLYLFLLAVVLGWLASRPTSNGFMRLPGGGFPAPDWAMTNLAGQTVRSSEFLGKVVVLNFWATWCPPCRRELPELNAFHTSRETNGVMVIGAATDEGGATTVQPFVKRHELNYPILLANPEVQQAFSISQLPTTWILDRHGRVAARYLGALTARELDRAVTPLLAPP
ncbi:MAG TPA: TlpA disulfide reductase family protein [Verrucomicrobiota bacterium]|nr:TlpA family protein disulfide reductase [Verrucomicrobiales bacterium]HRI15676.1 TlpA disulfide reductase family protein [Verrucomicrobiota bacterium]